MGRQPTLQEFADALGLKERSSIRSLFDKGMPRTIPEAQEWYRENIRGEDSAVAKVHRNPNSNFQIKLQHEAELKRIEVARRGLQLRQMYGQVVERDAVKRWARKTFTKIKERLIALPDELAMAFPPDQRASLIADVRESIRLVLLELGSPDDFESDD